MWIMTSVGFISVVANRDDPNTLLVRARAKGHIENIFPNADVFIDEGADYFYRAFIPRYEVPEVIANNINNIDYGNFKNSVKDKDYHDALLAVWQNMHIFQERLLSKIYPNRRKAPE